MKGIVAEINGKHAIVLTKEGVFKRIKAEPHMTVGSEVDIDSPKYSGTRQKLISKAASIAAAALLVLGTGYGAISYSMPYTYVDFDINPSIELTVNIYDRIINAEALNSDGQVLLENSKLKNTKLSEGVTQLIGQAAAQGYIKPVATDSDAVENAVLFTISSGNANKSKALKEELANTIEEKLSNESIVSDVLVGEATLEQREDARKIGTTPGKLALIENAIKAEPELSVEELKSAAVKDLVAKAKKSSQPKKDTENKDIKKENKKEDKKTGNKAIQPSSHGNGKEEKIVLGDEGYASGNVKKANNGKPEKNGSNAAGYDKQAKDNKQAQGTKPDKENKDSKNDKNNPGNKNNNINNNDKNNKNSNTNKNNSKNNNDKDNKNNNYNNNKNSNKQKPAQNEKKLESERQRLREELLKQINRKEKQDKRDNNKNNNLWQNQQGNGNRRKR